MAQVIATNESDRATLIRSGRRYFEYFTIGYNSLEGSRCTFKRSLSGHSKAINRSGKQFHDDVIQETE